MAENGFKPFQFSQLNQKKKMMQTRLRLQSLMSREKLHQRF